MSRRVSLSDLHYDFNGFFEPKWVEKPDGTSILCGKLLGVDSSKMIDSKIEEVMEARKKEDLYDYCAKRNIFL